MPSEQQRYACGTAATSCGGNSSSKLSPEEQALNDSLTTAWGYVAGGQAAQMLQAAPAGVKVDKEAFLRGVRLPFSPILPTKAISRV